MAPLRLLPPQVLLFGETVAGWQLGHTGTLQGLLALFVTYKGYDESMMLQQEFRGCIVSAVLSVLSATVLRFSLCFQLLAAMPTVCVLVIVVGTGCGSGDSP